MAEDRPGAGEPTPILTETPGETAQAVIRDGLAAYNLAQAGQRDARPLAIVVRDPATQEPVGGLLARTSMGLLFIERFFLPEDLRKHGLGSRILRMAEEEGARRGCTRAVLFTVHFQAPGFYLRQGWEVLGRLDCAPPGHTRFVMTKSLDQKPGAPAAHRGRPVG